MILQRLVEFDQKFGEGLPTGYQRLQVHYVLQLDDQGKLKAVVPVMEQQGKKTVGLLRPAPNLKRQGILPGAVLLVDDARYVLARGAEGDSKDYRPYRERYLELARSCADNSGDRRIRKAVEFLQGLDPQDPRFKDIQSNHRLDIEVGGQRIADLPEVQQFWAKHVREKTAAKGGAARAQCLVTGEDCEPVRIFAEKVLGVPNTNQGRGDLISFNAESFCSFGLEQSLNSPISPDASEGITRALNKLLATEKNRIRVGPVVYVAWARESTEFDFWKSLEEPQPEHIAQLVQSATKGGRTADPKAADFFVLSLSGSNSRIVVRDYHETTLENVKANLAKWFQRLQIVGTDGQPARATGVYRLAASLYRDANKEMPAHVPTALLSAALTGRPIPEYILGLAVKRNLAMQGPYIEFSRQRYLSVERLALIKAVLEQKEKADMSALNPNHPDPAYHCGRLLAVLEQIQWSALGDVNSTIVDRYYGAACTSPGTILGNLVNDAQPHLAKMRKDRGDGWAQTKLAEVLEAIGDEFPKTLPLSRQGLFALGFYHQKAHDRAASIEAKAAKKQQEGVKE